MSSTVDNRVVEMGFNNKQFEQGVAQSTQSLEGLKKSLDLTDSVRGIDALSAAGNKFSLDRMGAGVDRISSRFSALGVVGFTIIQNLTNAAIAYGKKLTSQLLGPIKEGFGEYETQMNAIQTVLANTESKGTTLDDVGKALDELNTYADKTIYNFSEMTRNIGTFTAAGVDLDTSVQAIKGIANLAAVSGSTSQQASTAMYQLSQALASGTVKLMDWNSVVNAGMGGQVFQDALKETARVHGIAIDDMIENQGSFRETLQEGWLSTDVLLETLQKFTGDLTDDQLLAMGYTEDQIEGIQRLGQTATDAATKVKTFTQLKDTIGEAVGSGWAKTWQIIIGDFEEAKAFFTEVSDIFGGLIQSSSDARNELLQGWKDMGGRTLLIETLRNSFEGLMSIMKPVSEAFREIFPPATAGQLFKLTLLLRNLSERFILTGKNAERVKRIFAGIFSVFAMLGDVIRNVVGTLFDLGQGLNIDGGGILEFFAKIGDALVALRKGTDISAGFASGMEVIRKTLGSVQSAIESFVRVVKEKIGSIRGWFSELFSDVDTSGFESFLEGLEIRFSPLTSLAKLAGGLMAGVLALGKKIMPILFKVASAIGEFAFNIGAMLYENISKLRFDKILDLINSGLFAALLGMMVKFLSSGSGVLDEMGGMFEGVADVLDGVRGTLVAYQTQLKAKALLTIAIAIGVLAVSLALLASIDSEKLTVALAALTGVFIELIAAMGGFNKLGGAGLGSAASLVAMSIAIFILVGAIKQLSKIDSGQVDNSLGTLFALMAGLALFSKAMSTIQGNLMRSSVGLIAFGVSLLIIVNIIRQIGNMDADVMAQGLKGLGIVMLEIAAFMRLVGNSKMGAMAGVGLIGMAISLRILLDVIDELGGMDVDALKQGLIAIGVLLLQLGLFTRLSSGGDMVATATGMVILALALTLLVDVIAALGGLSLEELGKGLGAMGIGLLLIAAAVRAMPKSIVFIAPALLVVAAALFVLSAALKQMGSMSWEEIGKGLLVLGGSLAILTVALYAMSGTLAGSAALLVAAGALVVLSMALRSLGQMSLQEIGLALLALVGVFAVLGVAGLVLAPLVPVLLSLGAALMMFGIGILLAGAGILAFSIALTTLAAAGTAAAVVIVGMIATLLGVVPLIITTLIDAIVLLAQGIAEMAPVLAEAITAIINGLLDVLINVIPKLVEALGVLIDGLISLMVGKIPDFVAAAIAMLLAILQTIAENIGEFTQAGMDILIGFLTGIRDNIKDLVIVTAEIVEEFLAGIAEKLPDIIQSGIDLMVAFIDGIAEGIENNADRVTESVLNLAKVIIDGLVEGIKSGVGAVWDAIKDVIQTAIGWLLDFLEADSPSKVFMRIGEYIPMGLAAGISNLGGDVSKAVTGIVDEAISVAEGLAAAIADEMNADIDLDPTIRPVVDMSEIINSKTILDDIFARKTLNLIPAITETNTTAARMDTYKNGHICRGDVTFTQNITSPKAISRIDVYRQTKNQIMLLKGLVNP